MVDKRGSQRYAASGPVLWQRTGEGARNCVEMKNTRINYLKKKEKVIFW